MINKKGKCSMHKTNLISACYKKILAFPNNFIPRAWNKRIKWQQICEKQNQPLLTKVTQFKGQYEKNESRKTSLYFQISLQVFWHVMDRSGNVLGQNLCSRNSSITVTWLQVRLFWKCKYVWNLRQNRTSQKQKEQVTKPILQLKGRLQKLKIS